VSAASGQVLPVVKKVAFKTVVKGDVKVIRGHREIMALAFDMPVITSFIVTCT